MATIIKENGAAEDRGLGAAGIIAIIVVVLLAAFLLFRALGARTSNTASTGTGVGTGAGDASAGTGAY